MGPRLGDPGGQGPDGSGAAGGVQAGGKWRGLKVGPVRGVDFVWGTLRVLGSALL